MTPPRAAPVPATRDQTGARIPPELIVALDVSPLAAARALVQRLRPAVTWFKVGSMLFVAAGPEAVRMVAAEGGSVFLDLKFHDIPQTIAGGVAAAAGLGVAMLTIHCAAGPDAMAAAADAARRASPALRLLGVTRLTSIRGRSGVLRAAEAAQRAGLHGVTAAVADTAAIKTRCGASFLVLTPGIRPAGSAAGDQVRVATPREAVLSGSDYLVVGRPIIAAPDPLAAAQAVLDEIRAALDGAPASRRAARGAGGE